MTPIKIGYPLNLKDKRSFFVTKLYMYLGCENEFIEHVDVI